MLQKTETGSAETNTRIIDYSRLVDTIELSTARSLDIKGSFEADNFAHILKDKTAQEREAIVREVGGRFDDALINFVTATLIARRYQRVVILAEASEGINGGLPWQPKLEEHLRNLKQEGMLQDTQLVVERYSTNDQAIKQLTDEAQALALETATTI
ncbi:MAG: hypothetical protein ACOH18_03995 [Candidatus Saccharimonadaceae bacterium]